MKEYLLQIGYTEEDIKVLLENGKAEEFEGDILVVDPNIFTVLVIKMLNDSLNPIKFFETEPSDNSLLYHVYKYIDIRMFKEARLLLEKYMETNKSLCASLLYQGLGNLEDRTEYMVDESKYDNPLLIEKLKQKELELLRELELDNQKEAYGIVKELKSIYRFNQEALPLVNICDFMMEARRISTNHRRVSHHTDFTMTGDFDSVVTGLLKEIDYYRLDRFIKDELETSTNPSIKLEIYNLFIEQIMHLNQVNLNYIQETMKIDVESKSMDEVLKYIHLPRIDDDFIYSLTHPVIEEDEYVNYYPIYEKAYKERKYDEAKDALIKFNNQMKRRNVYKEVDYQLNELNILIENEDVDQETLARIHDLEDETNALIEYNQFDLAIPKLHELYKLGKVPNPFVFNKIGYCYFKNNDYLEAIKYYSKASEGYISPEDIYNLLYSYFKIGKYDETLKLIPRYDMYYPEENIKLHYIEAICHVKLKEYREAVDSLESCEAMNVVYYNMPIEYSREKEIINKIQNGRNIECFTEDDFESYDLTEEETKLTDDIAHNRVNMITLIREGELKIPGLKEKIEYLLSCAKVYLQMGLEEEGTELCKFVYTMLQDPRLDKKEKETFTKRLKNYTTI